MRATLALPLGVLLLAAGRASAQDGPSFDCRYAETATEEEICASPRLARIERWVVEAYEDLASRIGERAARAIADEELARRQACEGDPACIEERLILTLQAFEANGATVSLPMEEVAPPPPPIEASPEPAPPPPPVEASLEPASPPPPELAETLDGPSQDEPSAIDELDVIDPEERLALGPPLELPDAAAPEDLDDPLPQAALAPFPGIDPDPELVALPEEDLSGSTNLEVEAETEPAAESGPGEASALAEAFRELPSYRRVNLQGRLAEAGYSAADSDGAWGPATQAGLAAFALDAAGRGRAFDVSTAEGAAALLDFLDSDDFKQTFLGEEVALDPEW